MPKIAKSPLALVLASVLASAVATAPAAAKPADQETRLQVEVKDRNGTTVYCVVDKDSSSLIPKKICSTRAEWIEAGATFRTTAKFAMNNAKDTHN